MSSTIPNLIIHLNLKPKDNGSSGTRASGAYNSIRVTMLVGYSIIKALPNDCILTNSKDTFR
jgi:hypothetical protein